MCDTRCEIETGDEKGGKRYKQRFDRGKIIPRRIEVVRKGDELAIHNQVRVPMTGDFDKTNFSQNHSLNIARRRYYVFLADGTISKCKQFGNVIPDVTENIKFHCFKK